MAKPSESSIVAKCALVLDVLAASRSPMTFSQLVEKTGFVKSSCHRILSVLMTERMVTFDKDTRRYETGERLNQWARLAWRRVDLQDVAIAEMRRLSDDLAMNVALSVLDGLTLLYLRTVDHEPLRYAFVMRDHAPLHCTAAGKVFLAHMTEARRNRFLDDLTFEKLTEKTISSRAELTKELSIVSKNGYGLSLEEEFTNVFGIAAPIWNEDNSVAACLSLWKSATQADARESLLACEGALRAASDRISNGLGWRGNA